MPRENIEKISKSPQVNFSADKARQGEIVLRKPWQRYVFLAGLSMLVVVALISTFAAG